jgi:hypothetical protein
MGIYSANSRICQREFTSENTLLGVESIEDCVFFWNNCGTRYTARHIAVYSLPMKDKTDAGL